MHTDEYEISLWREMTVCRSSIREIESLIANEKHAGPDLTFQAEKHEALKQWKTRLAEYEGLFRLLKI